ncbi:MAG: UDP-N-acetylmuramoyl-tripeptide--D-alanyl-D-alanine ligase [Microgenomates group bacterium Gr01-1014_16]|nr:MAG: UDP-N-acetylmuramoyl-tripeptide--D-alanyl-D-alanine ligase [Microgenomates group bacterium Gr01-1014_16]
MTNPLVTYLHILQLEGYQPVRFLRWWVKNPLKFRLENKKKLEWTAKAKFIYVVSGGFWPLMFVGLLALKPIEEIYKWRTKEKTREKIERLKRGKLKVIGIAGSYGKTSTKEFLYQILKSKYRVLRTPESYNTPMGIAKVVEMELDESYDFFICEMGEHARGDIKELCETVLPDYGVITGINEQHLERFASREEIKKTIYELKDWVGEIVEYKRGKGTPMEENLRIAREMAAILGVKTNIQIKPVEHRLKVIKRSEITIIDDAYSSNVDGFAAAVDYLKSFEGWKVIVTPGIAELGGETYEIHKRLGEKLRGLDQVILVGRNERTKGLEEGAGEVEYVDKVGEAVNRVSRRPAVVLFENDLPDNY